MKTKFTVSKTGWGIEEEDHVMFAHLGNISKESIATLLDKTVFFADKSEAGSAAGGTPLKRKVTITVVIEDVVPKEKKK